jgi:hypothetical protein
MSNDSSCSKFPPPARFCRKTESTRLGTIIRKTLQGAFAFSSCGPRKIDCRPHGLYGNPKKECRCSTAQVERYRAKISARAYDRILKVARTIDSDKIVVISLPASLG